MTEARVFHAFDQACLVSPVPFEQEPNGSNVTEESTRPSPHLYSSGSDENVTGNFPKLFVPRFPRDISEMPAVEAQAEDAFLSCLSGFVSSEGVRVWGDELERALGSARELMSCYGRLQAELRIVEVGRRVRVFSI